MKNENKKGGHKITFICFLAAAICYFISAAISISDRTGSGAVNICLGCTFLCLAFSFQNKEKDKNKDD